MDFSNKVIETKQKSDLRVGTIVYLESIANIKVRLTDKSIIPLSDESVDMSKTKVIYSLPSNINHAKFSKRTLAVLKPHNDLKGGWIKYKPGTKVYGSIVNNIFITDDTTT